MQTGTTCCLCRTSINNGLERESERRRSRPSYLTKPSDVAGCEAGNKRNAPRFSIVLQRDKKRFPENMSPGTHSFYVLLTLRTSRAEAHGTAGHGDIFVHLRDLSPTCRCHPYAPGSPGSRRAHHSTVHGHHGSSYLDRNSRARCPRLGCSLCRGPYHDPCRGLLVAVQVPIRRRRRSYRSTSRRLSSGRGRSSCHR